jgi:rhodanese-related sulfurtransferase
MAIATIPPQELSQQSNAEPAIELIDVRTPAEFRELHVPFARNVPLDQLDPAAFLPPHRDPSRWLYVICRSGSRGRQACEKLQAAGCQHVINVEGGTQAWSDAGLPVVRGRKVMSLERQVRIAAGFLVFAGTALGALHRPYWLGLSAFVGLGLMFAGITDTCGMGLLLARMPWNQVRPATTSPGVTTCHTRPLDGRGREPQ